MSAHRRLGLDRHEIRFKMQQHINERLRAAMVDFGRGRNYPVCREYIAQEINYACSVLRRELIIKEASRGNGKHFAFRHEHYLYLNRVCRHARNVRLRLGAQSGPAWPDVVPLTPRLP